VTVVEASSELQQLAAVMAELATISLAACIVNFADFGIKVAVRLHEFRSAIPLGEEPKPFRDIIIELPLLIDTLKRTREQAENGQISEATSHSLMPVIQGCHDQIKQLDEILQTLPNAQDSSWKRSVKAVASIGKEKKFVEVANTLKEYVQFLTYHQAAAGWLSPPLEVPRSLSTESIVEPVFLVPFERDSKFVGRSELVSEIDRRLKVHRRVALAGIGGVGYVKTSAHPVCHLTLNTLLIDHSRTETNRPSARPATV
jgi:N-terminal domain on NACHT_NTPase and P-loop NTPases